MKSPSAIKVAIVIPAYNEGKVIYSVVRSLYKTLGASPYTYQIIVVADGSQDNTPTEAARAGAFVIKHIINTGTGGATATGLSYAHQSGYDVAVTCDGDGQHDPSDVIKGIDILLRKNLDLLIGSRLIDTHGMPKSKVLGNKGLSLITFALFGINVTDSQSGLRVFSKQALAKLKWKTSGYEFCSEMLWRARQLGMHIDEFPIRTIYTDYSVSKGQNNWNGLNIVSSLLQRRILELFNE